MLAGCGDLPQRRGGGAAEREGRGMGGMVVVCSVLYLEGWGKGTAVKLPISQLQPRDTTFRG
jgi:hypothetical protein